MAEQLLQASRSGAAAHYTTTKECLQGCVEIMNKRDLENPVPFPLVCVRQLRRAFLWKVFILGRGNQLAMRVDEPSAKEGVTELIWKPKVHNSGPLNSGHLQVKIWLMWTR